MTPASVLVHVHDIKQALDWYQKAFPLAVPTYLEEFDFTVLRLENFNIEIVQADAKVSAGKCGTVLYWSVDCLQSSLDHFVSLGARLYRGPIKIEDDLSMCQMEDPFGNLIGLRGK